MKDAFWDVKHHTSSWSEDIRKCHISDNFMDLEHQLLAHALFQSVINPEAMYMVMVSKGEKREGYWEEEIHWMCQFSSVWHYAAHQEDVGI